MKKLNSIIISTLTIAILSGCSQKSQPDTLMVKKYNETTKSLQKDQTRINIIRENSIIGAGVLTYIKCNNKIHPLSSGTTMSCNTSKDINTLFVIHNIGGLIPSYNLTSIIPIDNRLNEDVFLYAGALNPIKEINAELGKTLIVDFNKPIMGKEEDLLNFDPEIFTLINPDQFLLLSPSYINNYIQSKDKYHEKFIEVVNDKYKKEQQNSKNTVATTSEEESKKYIKQEIIENMSKDELNRYRFDRTLMKVDDNKQELNLNESKVILFRKADNGSSYLGIWNEKNFIGDLGVESYIDYRTKDNKLILHSYYHNWRTFELDLEKGKTYYVNVDFDLGWSENTIEFKQVSEKIFEETKNTLGKITLDNSKITPLMKKRLNRGLDLIKKEFH